MITRDTTRSDAIVRDYQGRRSRLDRKDYEFSGSWKATPKDVFPLLCPAREADWIPGWHATILHSGTGYAEDRCVFSTDEACVSGSGLWTFTGYRENEYVRFVRFAGDTLTHGEITLRDNGNGTTTGTWHLTITALNPAGNERIAHMDGDYGRGLVKLIDAYLATGKMAEAELVDAWTGPEPGHTGA